MKCQMKCQFSSGARSVPPFYISNVNIQTTNKNNYLLILFFFFFNIIIIFYNFFNLF